MYTNFDGEYQYREIRITLIGIVSATSALTVMRQTKYIFAQV